MKIHLITTQTINNLILSDMRDVAENVLLKLGWTEEKVGNYIENILREEKIKEEIYAKWAEERALDKGGNMEKII